MLVLSSRVEDEEKEASRLSCNSCNCAEKIKVQQYNIVKFKNKIKKKNKVQQYAVLNNNKNNMQFSLVKSR